jgi:hypothetical protein
MVMFRFQMIKSLTSQLGIKGHLTVHKVVDGQEELVYDEDNVIVSGFGWALAHLYGQSRVRHYY